MSMRFCEWNPCPQSEPFPHQAPYDKGITFCCPMRKQKETLPSLQVVRDKQKTKSNHFLQTGRSISSAMCRILTDRHLELCPKFPPSRSEPDKTFTLRTFYLGFYLSAPPVFLNQRNLLSVQFTCSVSAMIANSNRHSMGTKCSVWDWTFWKAIKIQHAHAHTHTYIYIHNYIYIYIFPQIAGKL